MSLVGGRRERSSGVRFILHVFIILSLSPSCRYVSCSIPDAVSNCLCRVEWEYDFERPVSPPEGFDPRSASNTVCVVVRAFVSRVVGGVMLSVSIYGIPRMTF